MDQAGAALLTAARNGRLVVFVGAGASMGPPTNLPSWRDVNRIVVRSLASTASLAVGSAAATSAADLILARHEKEKLPPEYQAQLLAEFLYHRYFDVLRYIDSDLPNDTHLSIAWLARLGCVRAVITTNFDRVLEAAFVAANVPLERHFQPEHFKALAADLGRFERRDGACQLLKLHGSVDDPKTLIDTLAQRKKGLGPDVLSCVHHLIRSQHWLFLGFSGLDLEAEPNYLGLSQEADTAVGFTWFVRETTAPKPAVVKLKERYGNRGNFVQGELPDWLVNFNSAISREPAKWIAKYRRRIRVRALLSTASPSPTSALEAGASAWALNLAPTVCAMCLAFVVTACSEPQSAAALVATLLRTLEAREAATPSDGSLSMKAIAASALGVLLAGLRRHEEAVHWLSLAVEQAERALGRVDEARALYESALAGYRTRGDPVPIAFGLGALAAHLIRQLHLDDAKALATEAIAVAKTAGDERLRGTALNDLGLIAKLKGEYDDALSIFSDVEQLFARLGNDAAVAAALGNRGEVLAALGHFDEAQRLQMSVLAVNERLERRDNQGANYLSLGLLEQERGDTAAAEQWYDKAVDVFRAIKDPSNQALALYRLASLAAATQRFEQAIELAQRALPLVTGRNAVLTSDLWAQIGQASLRLGRLGRAEEALRETIALAEKFGATKSVASSAQNLGTALLLQQRNGEAAAAFERAAGTWERLGDTESLEYSKLGIAAVRLDERVAAMSNAGHAATDPEQRRAAAREVLELYPKLISMYEQFGALQLTAAFCVAAASTAQFVEEDARAVELFRRGASVYEHIGAPAEARTTLERARVLLQHRANTLLRASEMADAVPVLIELAEVSEALGNRESQATALYNASLGILTSGDFVRARALAQTAADLYDPDSNDAATARELVAFCDTSIDVAKD
jgi:tetratricopeptide (TPR) repeat protein